MTDTTSTMRHNPRRASRRAGPLLAAFLVVAGTVGAFAPLTPTARAEDATPTPSIEPSSEPTAEPTAEPTPEPTAEPTPEPTAEPTPAPTADPSSEPTAEPTPAPTADPSSEPSSEPSAEPTADPSAEPAPGPSATPAPSGPLVQHAWVDTVDDRGDLLSRGLVDAALPDAQRFTVYRVRFQVANHGEDEVVMVPTLEVQEPTGWTPLPFVDPVRGVPFYGAADDGRLFTPRRETIEVGALRLADDLDPSATPVAGESSAGRPIREIGLPAHSYTELEYAIRATVGAEWGTRYAFRLTDGPEAIEGAMAELVMGTKPGVDLSPGQRGGKPIKDPVPLYRLDPSIGSTDLPLAQDVQVASVAQFNLRGPVAAPVGTPISPHIQFGLASDTCASCHAAHDAQGPMLLQQPDPQSGTCFTCHDGTGALSDVRSDWADAALPANDPSTGSYYSHPATTTGSHESGVTDEFAGVLDRHAVCADCHQPHLSDDTRAIQTTAGWSTSGAIQAPGVGVTNGEAGTTPAYAWKPVATLEYELCFKCHSGYTTLPAQDPAHPSRWALDKAIELNPANTSYHPVEAAGTNQTSAMAASLAGTSPYKLWNFETDETVRCASCHGDSDVANVVTPPRADASLDNHASPNRGILIAPYRDRLLKSVADPYLAQDFALCYVCHAEAPQLDDSGDGRMDTNFGWHGYHNTSIAGNGIGGTDIDVAGAGRGNAICAECHFRTHGTALATGTQAQASRLVTFAPNVRPVAGVLKFTPAGPSTLGYCTLNCHGKTHVNYDYDPRP